ncbi:hypothetical protein [Veronia pacifica]|uniref:Uncharacterized protein n=1 Tax=Veronia pacifica TaxID=1080227 RepID=A0A1C3EC59_9GAMM|nr:hypothetical protein [Veronia pacifica]ODA30818.1 hypothetical protein A8L45_19070 [Veronia pacifica]
MTFTVSSWLDQGIDEYKEQLREVTLDFFNAENNLNRSGAKVHLLMEYFDCCMRMADLSRENGDDTRYLQGLRKIYCRMMSELNNKDNSLSCRMLSRKFARETLTRTCELYKEYDITEKAKILCTDFVQRSSLQ